MEITFDLNILLAFGVFITPISAVGIRHYIIKSRCFTILQQKVENLETHDEGSSDTHKEIFDRLNSLDKNVHLILGAMKIKPVD